MNNFDIETYMAKGVENVVKTIVKTSFFCPEETAFVAKFALASKKATKIREKYNQEGIHIPAFLIASITSACNLHCAGCYARSLSACDDDEPFQQMSREEWKKIFDEATDLGISFILLAGGEPLVRKDVIEEAAKVKNIMFPIFTNGTMIGKEYLELFDKNRNLVPVLSIEGEEDYTDARRGEGIYSLLSKAMEDMKRKRIAFATSLTVTKDNYKEVTSEGFIDKLIANGCKAFIYVEYVPIDAETENLAPSDEEREWMTAKLNELRVKYENALFVSFPGDEKSSDGCLAAGRGFFHINSHGMAEPCPFSPYSDISVKECGLKEAIKSKLFTALREGDILIDDHKGGCVLFERREQVEALINNQK